MFPIGDDNPTLRPPVATRALLVLLASAWMVWQGGGFDATTLATTVCNWGMVPGELTGQSPVGTAVPIGPGLACVVDEEPLNVLTPFTSMFLHGSWGHVLGNCLFLWVFGDNVEDVTGRRKFVIFYLLCGLAAAAAQAAVAPASPAPMVGASGAISGVLGGYLLLFPRVRVKLLVILIIFVTVIHVPAWVMLLYWFGLQLLSGLPELSPSAPDVSSGVAFWAHVGGFVAGMVLIRFFVDDSLREAHRRMAARGKQRQGALPR